MLIKILERNNHYLKLTNLFKVSQRECQTKCAIDQLKSNEFKDEKIKNNNFIDNEKVEDLLSPKKLTDEVKKKKSRSTLFFQRIKDGKFAEIKQNFRIEKYKKAMGLPDNLSDEESLRIISEYFNRIEPGLRFFEKTGSPIYGKNFNSPIWYRADENKKDYKYIAAELFEKNVIYDFSYDSFMNQKEKNSLIYQMMICLGLNFRSNRPFPLLFANLDKNSYCYKKLNQFFFSTNKLSILIKMTDKSYLDLIPKEEIIYLSPHAEESLTEFKPEYHYVIGCFIDISFSKSLSFKKAQAEGVKCYKLPIDEFVNYSKARNKLLPLPIVQQILLDKKINLDWKETLECNLGSNRLNIEMKELDTFEKKYKNIKKHSY